MEYTQEWLDQHMEKFADIGEGRVVVAADIGYASVSRLRMVPFLFAKAFPDVSVQNIVITQLRLTPKPGQLLEVANWLQANDCTILV